MGADFDLYLKLAVSLKNKCRDYVLLCGAGVSRDAGVPTGWEIQMEVARQVFQGEKGRMPEQEELENWYLNEVDPSLQSYSGILEALFDGEEERRSFLTEFFKDKEPGPAHLAIAKIVAGGYIRFIFTTNFDPLLELAFDKLGLQGAYSVISAGEQLDSCEPWDRVRTCRIYKLHGDYRQGKIRNVRSELESLDERMAREFQEIIDRHGLIVLGYAGRDPGVMNHLLKRPSRAYGCFWQYVTFPETQDPEFALFNEFVANKRPNLIQNDSASAFLDEITARIDKLETHFDIPAFDQLVDRVERKLANASKTMVTKMVLDSKRVALRSVQNQLHQVRTTRPHSNEDLINVWKEMLLGQKDLVALASALDNLELPEANTLVTVLPDILELFATGWERDLGDLLLYSLYLLLGGAAYKAKRFAVINDLFRLQYVDPHRQHRMYIASIISFVRAFVENYDKARAQEERRGPRYFPHYHLVKELAEAEFGGQKTVSNIREFDFLVFCYFAKDAFRNGSWLFSSSVYFEHNLPQCLSLLKEDPTLVQLLFDESNEEFWGKYHSNCKAVAKDMTYGIPLPDIMSAFEENVVASL